MAWLLLRGCPKIGCVRQLYGRGSHSASLDGCGERHSLPLSVRSAQSSTRARNDAASVHGALGSPVRSLKPWPTPTRECIAITVAVGTCLSCSRLRRQRAGTHEHRKPVPMRGTAINWPAKPSPDGELCTTLLRECGQGELVSRLMNCVLYLSTVSSPTSHFIPCHSSRTLTLGQDSCIAHVWRVGKGVQGSEAGKGTSSRSSRLAPTFSVETRDRGLGVCCL